jgi:SOS response regulatory protein OraA/RecX
VPSFVKSCWPPALRATRSMPILDALAAQGYLSDDRYARAVVRQKSGAYSKRAIAQTLKAKGVTGDAATEALGENAIDDQDALVALWRRRFGRAPADDREKARQIRFLHSRGFSLVGHFQAVARSARRRRDWAPVLSASLVIGSVSRHHVSSSAKQ